MPLECSQLDGAPEPLLHCPKCGKPFESFLRGMVQSWWRQLFGLPYCASICHACKKVVGWEEP